MATGERSTGSPSNSLTDLSLVRAGDPAPTSTPGVGPRANLYACLSRFLDSLSERVLVADGAMGTMLHAAEPTLDDYQGHEGCSEILSVTRPDVVRGIHDAYLAAGADCVETNTFGANLSRTGRVRPRRPDLRAVRGGCPAGPRGRRRLRHPGPAPVRARLDRVRARNCRRSATPPYATLRDAYQRTPPA